MKKEFYIHPFTFQSVRIENLFFDPGLSSVKIASMINQDLLIGAGCAFTILTIIFTLYLTVFRNIMPDHKEDDGKPFFPFDEK